MSELETSENKEPIGILFDSMNYYSNEDLNTFISSINQEQALFCIIEACKAAYDRKSFSLLESEVLSKSLRIMTK
jgi:hypothetical protein